MSAPGVFQRPTAAFDRAGIAYTLSGSFASAYHGALRSTQNIDFVIEATPAQLRAFMTDSPGEAYYADLEAALEALRRRSLFNVIEIATGWKIDLIIRKARPFSEEEFRRRQTIDLQGVPVSVASAGDVIISKLEWSKLAQSQRQVEDVVGILRVRWESLDRSYLEKWIVAMQLSTEWKAALRAAGIST
jgi:hypothetical protein